MVAVFFAALAGPKSVRALDQTLRPQDFKGITLGGQADYGKVMASSGEWLAVGAPGMGYNQFGPADGPDSYEGGRVLLWKRDYASGVWKLKQALTSPGVNYTPLRFGARLAMDGSRLLVADEGQSGRVHAFKLEADVWSADGTLSLGGDAANGFTMNGAIALSGDYAAIGSPNGNADGVGPKGGIDIFQRQNHAWVRVSRVSSTGLAVSNVGKFLALSDSTVYASYVDAPPDHGGVMVYEKTSNGWVRTRTLPEVPKVRSSSIQLQVSAGRLYVVTDTVDTVRHVQEFRLSAPGTPEVFTTQFDSFWRTGNWHVSGSVMIMAHGSSTSRASVFRRQLNNAWDEESPLDTLNHSLYAPISAVQVAGSEILISGRRAPQGGGIGPQTVPDSVQVMRRQQNTWNVVDSLIPIAAERVRDGDFGRSIATSDSWLLVGSPGYNNSSRRTGLAYLYRRGPHTTFQFHSLLPDPILGNLPYQEYAYFGGAVATSGNWAAVSLNRADPSGLPYGNPSCVVLYGYDVSTDSWRQLTVIPPPAEGREGFGFALALQGDRLVVGAPSSSHVYIYSLSPSQGLATLEATLKRTDENMYFGKAVALDGDRVLIGAPAYENAAAFVYEKKSSGWVQTARLTAPASSIHHWTFAQPVALSGTQAIVGGLNSGPGMFYSLVGSTWKAQKTVFNPEFPERSGALAMSGNLAVFSSTFGLCVAELQNGTWKVLPSAFRSFTSYSGGVAIQGEQIIARQNEGFRELRVLDMNRPPTVSFDASDITPPNGGVITFDAGDFVPGVEVKQFAGVTLHHQGIVPTKVNLEILGGGGEITLKTNPVSLAPGDSKVLDLTFLPVTTGPKEFTLIVTPDTDNAGPQVFRITYDVDAAPTQLQFTTLPQARLVSLDLAAPELYVTVTGTRPWSYRWYKNGKALPKETSFYTTAKDPGLYHVVATNPHGSVSTQPVPIGFFGAKSDYGQAVLTGSTVRKSVIATGPGVKVRWVKDEGMDPGPTPLTDGPEVSGSQTANLTVKNVRTNTYYTAYITMPSGIGEEELPGEVSYQVEVSPPPKVEIYHAEQLVVGEPAGNSLSFGVEYYASTYTPYTFRVSGLPPGVKVSSDGDVSGAPTTAGVYTVTATVSVNGFTGPSQSARVVVTKYSNVNPGFYWAFIPASEASGLGGAVMLDVTPGGSFSGSLYFGLHRTPVAGTFSPTLDLRSKDFVYPLSYANQDRVFYLQAQGNIINVFIRDKGTPVNVESPEVLASLDLIKPLVPAPVTPKGLGRHNFALLNPATSDSQSPHGHGFGTLTVAADRRVTYTVQLADGTTLTGTSWLGSGAAHGMLYFYQGDAKTRSHLRGAVPLRMEDAPDDTLRNLTWQRIPTSSNRAYPQGFGPVQIAFASSRYPAPGGAGALPGTAHQARLSVQGLDLATTPFVLSSKGFATFSPGAENPHRMRVDIYPPTGVYTGQISLTDPDPANSSREIIRNVPLKGILLPEWEAGPGFFLLPSLPDASANPPTTLTTSPLFSGSILLEPVSQSEPTPGT